MAKAKKLPSGSWRVNQYVGKDADGKRIYKSFTASTAKEAEFLASSYRYMTDSVEKTPSDMTLSDAYARYIESKSNVLSPSTLREYKASAARDFPDLMPVKLSAITQERIQIAVNRYAMGRSPKTVRNAHSLLASVLKVYKPYFNLVTRLPQKEKNEIEIPEESEVKALLDATQGTPMHTAILLGAVGTLRRSEVCALLTDDVTDSGMYINKAMVLDENKQWVIKTTKTTAGTRFVTLPKSVIDELRSRDGRVYPYAPSTLTNKFALLCQRVLGKSYHFHALRHYSASTLHALGMPDAYIMQRGGWDSREVLDRIYTHVLSDNQRRLNDRADAYFDKAFSSEKSSMQHEIQHEIQ